MPSKGRFLRVAQLECDDEGKLLVSLAREYKIPVRDVKKLRKKGPVRFIRYAVVDRAKRNITIFSSYDLDKVNARLKLLNQQQENPVPVQAQPAPVLK